MNPFHLFGHERPVHFVARSTAPGGDGVAGHPPEYEPAGFSFDGEFGAGFQIAIVDLHKLTSEQTTLLTVPLPTISLM